MKTPAKPNPANYPLPISNPEDRELYELIGKTIVEYHQRNPDKYATVLRVVANIKMIDEIIAILESSDHETDR